jgi:acetolactate synthase-1/2/3 large subunit
MVIMNNQHLGMVAQWEDRFYGSQRGNTELKSTRVDHPYPRFVEIAQGYLVPGEDVWTVADLRPAVSRMLAADGPYLLDVHVEYHEHVLPMIPAGGTYKNIMLE